MLTFFEYLRQRAFESVVAGATEGLEFLELERRLAEPQRQLPQPGQSNDAAVSKPPRMRDDLPGPAESPEPQRPAADDALPRPRTQGRPPGQGGGGK